MFGSCFFDALFPKRCASCGCQGEWLCPPCSELLFFRANQDCLVCGKPNTDGAKCHACGQEAFTRRVMCAFSYRQDVAVKLVKLFKYDFVKSADKIIIYLLVDFLKQQECLDEDLLVMAVPLHAKRLRWRGYNQSAIMAEAVAKYFNLQYDNEILVRRKATKPQAKMEIGVRCSNVDGCFSVQSGYDLKGKRILLVDDVITTGATIEACASALKQAGARSVDALAFIRG